MNISESPTPDGHGARVIRVAGRIDQSTADNFSQMLKPYLDACDASSAPLVIDFSGVEYISSVGLRVLMLAARQVKAQNGKVAIAALTPVVAEVFQISRFNLVFKVLGSVEQACEALAG